MKTEAEVKEELKALREFIDGEESTELQKRVAYEIETAVRYVTENVVGWPDLVTQAKDGAHLILMSQVDG